MASTFILQNTILFRYISILHLKCLCTLFRFII
uniref:Uncharacterized protein n=1 Tax=Anguilla anguilla TaxID=7936 RepID=A0A0E9PRE0_ANGAN